MKTGLKAITNLDQSYADFGRSTSFAPKGSGSPGRFGWIVDVRAQAERQWRSLGYPTAKNEDWKYTSVAPISEAVLELASPADAAQFARFESALPIRKGDMAAELVFFNGHFMRDWSSISVNNGLTVLPFSAFWNWKGGQTEGDKSFERDVELLKGSLMAETADDRGVFAWINDSFFEEGAFIRVGPQSVIDKPIHVLFVSSGVDSKDKKMPTSYPRLFARLERMAQASLVETFVDLDGGRYFSNSVTDIRLEAGARLSHCRLQTESEDSFHIGETRIRQARDSWSETYCVSLGSKMSRQNLTVRLEGEAAETTVDGLYMVHDRQHVDHHTLIDHVVGNTVSEQLYKGILDDESRAVFNGRVRIQANAQKANASQLNNNLILNPKAEVDIKPELEIFADDVKATHGATIGRLNAEEMFYFQSRAIEESEAVRMLSRGFVTDVLYRMQNEAIRKKVSQAVDDKFATLKVGKAK